jgi:hypothetical protein
VQQDKNKKRQTTRTVSGAAATRRLPRCMPRHEDPIPSDPIPGDPGRSVLVGRGVVALGAARGGGKVRRRTHLMWR